MLQRRYASRCGGNIEKLQKTSHIKMAALAAGRLGIFDDRSGCFLAMERWHTRRGWCRRAGLGWMQRVQQICERTGGRRVGRHWLLMAILARWQCSRVLWSDQIASENRYRILDSYIFVFYAINQNAVIVFVNKEMKLWTRRAALPTI